MSYQASDSRSLKLSWSGLMGGVLFLVGLGSLYRQPAYTDGMRWVLTDSCRYHLAGKLPFWEARPFEAGDMLMQIDYTPACSLAIPPTDAATSIHLYEIARSGEKHLLFAEFRPYPSFGWFQREMTLKMGIVLFLIFSAVGVVFLRAMIMLRQYVEVGMRLMMAMGWLFLVYGVLMGWVYETYYREVNDWAGMVAGVIGLSWGLWRVEVGAGAGFLAGLMAWLWPSHADVVVGAALGAWGFKLRGVLRWPYWGGWLFWTYTYDLLGLFVLPAIIVWDSLSPFVRNAYKVLAPLERYFYLSGFFLAGLWAVGIGAPFREVRGWNLVLGVIGGGMVGWLGLEGLYWFYRRHRAHRRALLERELPLLWEVPDAASLAHRVREILTAYWGAGQAEIVEAPGPQRLWLRRRGEPPPYPDWEKKEVEVAIPLGEPYWLLVGQTRAPLTVEDIAWLVHFSRYVGISRRHLALYEAAHEARLQALRHQLSPHFLFNALHTLQGLLYEDVALAEKLLARLGQLLRRSLELAKHLLIPLSEEIALVQDYLEIEKQRYGQRLIVQWEVIDPPPEVPVPPFTIQTLVENAIKHAVAKQMRPTTLHLRVSRQNEKLQISITDDGPGFTDAGSAQGIGLSNLRTRLTHIYGREAQLAIAGTRGKGVKVEVILPLSPPNLRTALPDRNQNPGVAPSSHD